jgi:hypothetical protein
MQGTASLQDVDADILGYQHCQCFQFIFSIHFIPLLPQSQEGFLHGILSLVCQFLAVEELSTQLQETWPE